MMFTDRLFLSRYSLTSIAAALPAGVTKFMITSLFLGTVTFSGVFVAQYMGAGKPEKAAGALWQGLYLAVASGFLHFALFFFGEDIFVWGGYPPEIVAEEAVYFRTLLIGTPFELVMFTMSVFLASIGRARMVMWVNLLGTLVNIPLDYFLIFGLDIGGATIIAPMGILGAALGTVFSWVFAAALFALLIFNRAMEKSFRTRSSRRFNPALFWRILKYGYPSGIQLFLEIFAFTYFSFAVGSLGELIIAGNNIVFSIEALSFFPMLGVGQAVSILVGHAIGRGKPKDGERAALSGVVLSTIYVFLMCVFYVGFPEPIIKTFMPKDIDPASVVFLVDLGKTLLRFVVFYCLLDGLYLCCFGAIKGAGDVIFPMLAMGFWAVVGLVIPITILFKLDMANIYAMWYAMVFYVTALTLTGVWRFCSRKWMTKKVIEVEIL
jgi:MATE family multidrug resistance protein